MESNIIQHHVVDKNALPPVPTEENSDHPYLENSGSLVLKATLLRMIPFVAIARGGLKLFARHPFAIGLPIAVFAYLYRSARDLDDQYSLPSQSEVH